MESKGSESAELPQQKYILGQKSFIQCGNDSAHTTFSASTTVYTTARMDAVPQIDEDKRPFILPSCEELEDLSYSFSISICVS